MNYNDFIAISLKTQLMFKESSMWRTRVLYVYLNYQDSVLVTFNNQPFFLPNDSILHLDGKVATNIDLQQAISIKKPS